MESVSIFSFLCLTSGFEETDNSNLKFFSPGENAHDGQRQTSSGEGEGEGKQLEVCFFANTFSLFFGLVTTFLVLCALFGGLASFRWHFICFFLVEVPPLVQPFFYFIFSRSYTELKQEFEGEVTRWES